MAADIAELGFKVDTSDIDHAIKKFSLLDREFGKVGKSGGLVSRSFESVGESGKKSGGLVSRAFREASQDLDKTLRSVAKLIPMLKAAASELGDFANKYRRVENLSSIDINVKLDTKRAIKDIAELKAIAKSTTISIDARINDRASGALASTAAAVYSLTTAVAIGLAPLKAYSGELGQLAQNAKDAAKALTGASSAAGRGISGDVPNQAAPIGGDSALRRHGLAVYDVTQRYAGLAARLIAAKAAVAVLTAAVVSAIPVLGQMAAIGAAAFGTALATANVANASKELENLARSTDMSKQSLQEWRLAGRFEGIAAELNEFGDMSKVFGDMNKSLKSLGTEEGKAFAASMQSIGLSVEDLKGKKADEALLKIGDALSKSKLTEAQKSSILAGISDDAANLWPLLEKSGQKLSEITQYAHAVGAIQSDAQLASMKQTNTELSYFKVGLEGVQVQLAAVGSRVVNTLGPNIRQLFIDAKGPLDDWALSVDIVLTKFKHDLDATGSWGVAFSRMFEGMYPTLHQFLSSAGAFGKGYGEAFIAPMMDALKRGYASIGEALSAAGGAESLGAALGKAMLPVVTIVDTVVGSIKILITNWEMLKAAASITPVGLVAANWDAVTAAFNAVGNAIKGVAEYFGLINPATAQSATGVQMLVATLGALVIAGGATRLALGAVGAVISTVQFAFAPLMLAISAAPAIFGALSTAIGFVGSALGAVSAVILANPITATIAAIAGAAALIYANWDSIGPYFSNLWTNVSTIFQNALGEMANAPWYQIPQIIMSAFANLGTLLFKTGVNAIGELAVGIMTSAGVPEEKARGIVALVIQVIFDLPSKLLEIGANAAMKLGEGLLSMAGVPEDKSKKIMEGVKGVFSMSLPELLKTGSELIKNLASGIASAHALAFDAAKKIASDVIAALKDLGSKAIEAGKNVAAGLKDGIMSGIAGVVSSAKATAQSAINAVTGVFQIKSPSRVMRGLGVHVSSGLALGIEAGNPQVINAAQTLSLNVTDEFGKLPGAVRDISQEIGQALTDGLFSGNWKAAGQSILGSLKSYLIDPLKKQLSDSLGGALNGGGFMGNIAKSLGLDKIGGALGGVGSSIGGLFSGIASSAANGFTGIGTAISGGLSGIMGSFGTLVSAIPGWGWAIAGVAALAKLFGGPSAPKINLTQGARDGQGMLTDGQQHYTKTALGTVGATDSSYKIGREKGFVPKLHEWFKWVESFDGMIAKTLPNSIASISEALKGVEMKGANLEGFTRQRLHTIFSALPEALQVAIQGGKNIMAGTTEEIAARFAYMAQVAESGLIPALEQLGLAGTQSKESMIAFAMSLADAMGGIDKAKAALDNYYQAAYTEAERLALNQSAAKTKLDEYNKSLGLSGSQYIDTIAKLRARIDAEDASTAAGQKNIATLLGMVDALKTLSGTAEEAAAKLKQQWTDFNSAAYTDAQRENIAKKQAQKLVDQFNQTYGTALNNIIDARQLMRTIDTTTEGGKKMQQALLGLTGSLVTLGGTAEQIKEKIAGLKEGIKGLVSNLYGSGSTTSTSTVATTDANQAALSAANATLDSLRSRYDEEKQRIDDVNSQAREAYNDQMDYYRAMHDAMQSLLDLANGFADDARSASDTLKAAQLDYNATLKAAQGGDVEAAKKLGDAANRLKTSLGTAYNNDNRAASAIQQIEQQLRSTAGILGNLAGTEPTDPGTIASTVLASLESQIKAQEAIVSSLQSVVSSTNSATNEAKAAADRTALAKELATKVGELGLATDKSAWQILAANGINIKDLATDFGINLSKLDTTFVKKTADLADRLNVNSLDLLTRLNVNFADLARSFNIDVNNLNNGTLTKLDKLADQLRVSSVDLAAKLGINIDQLGDLMANKLAALPNIPADIKAGLAPHLQDIRNAADPATLQRELKELQAYVNSLPPGIKDKLNDQLQGILGYTGDTKTNTNDTKTETMALRNVSGRVSELTLYTRDELTGQYITKMLQNSRALNQNAANIGKSTIPSFAVGSDKLPNDMLANVHRGEMIFTAPQSQSMRDLAIYNQSVIPQIASYLSDIAANDNQAPVFIQPVINSPRSANNNTGRDELLEEVKGLRKDNAELKKAFEGLMPYQSAIANNTRKSAATLDKWDTDGVPEERVA